MSEDGKSVSASGIDIIRTSVRRDHDNGGQPIMNSMEDDAPAFGMHQPASRQLIYGVAEALGMAGREKLMEEQIHLLQQNEGLQDRRVSDSGFAVTESQIAPARKPSV